VSGIGDADPAQVIQPDQMQKGFLNVVSAVEDLQIDVPEAPDLVANFVARAVVDDILPPAFVDRLPSGALRP
jgi:programmed cell death protein 4